jgi:hypothetical protein
MAILGVLLIVLGIVLNIYYLWVIGLILLVVGLVFWFAPVGGSRRRWY